MKVEQFMTKNPVTVEAEASLDLAARQIRDKGVGSLVVLRDGKVAGLVTDRMLVTHGMAEGRDNKTAVEDVMLENPACLEPEDNIFHAVDAMRGANVARRIPVVNAYNELLGIVSISDIAVVAKDLIDAIMLEETHHALEEARVMTGGKRLVKEIRRPTKQMPVDQETHVTREPTPEGPPTKGGNVPVKER
jgi:signal-transduction protein with cAMP-binding, CBS, and nucleotidyltransferase domain